MSSTTKKTLKTSNLDEHQFNEKNKAIYMVEGVIKFEWEGGYQSSIYLFVKR